MPGGASIPSAPEPRPLSGRVALVTGASGAIGGAIAAGLARAGAHVVAAGRRAGPLEEVCSRIRAEGGRADPLTFDVARPADAGAAVAQVERQHGRLDVLVTCAGAQARKPALEIREEDWDRVHDVNLKGVFFTCQAAAAAMVRNGGGAIVNVTSLTAEFGLPHLAPYAASKGGVRQLTMALATEWAPLGIRVNSVGPGRIRTPMTEEIFRDPVIAESFLRLIPMGRPGTPEDVVGAVLFLASDAAAYVTGQAIYVDGGWLASGGSPKR